MRNTENSNQSTQYATIVLKYVQDETTPNMTKFMNKILSAIQSYNENQAGFGYSKVDFVGFYIDPDDMSIEEQNQLNQESKLKIHSK